MRVDLYSLIHKAQRKHLFDLSVKIGRADFSNVSQVAALKEEIKTMIDRLHKHAEVEETFIYPLFQEIGTQGDLIANEHEDLKILLEDLENSLAGEDQEALYTQFNQFLVSYLTHLDAEETAQKEILWKHYDDEPLKEVMQRFTASRTPAQSMVDLEFMFPCLSPREIEGMLNGMKGKVPDVVYEAVSSMAHKATSIRK